MEIFNSNPGFVYLEDIEFNTLINEAESGKEKRRNKWPTGTINNEVQGYAKRSFRLTYKSISQTEYSYITKFFRSRVGRKEAFYFENFNESPIIRAYPDKIILVNSYAGEATTSTVHFPLISGSVTIYDDGVALTESYHYTIDLATGVITWVAEHKPENGSVIRADYRFYREVRFDSDKLTPERINFNVYNLDLLVKETAPRL